MLRQNLTLDESIAKLEKIRELAKALKSASDAQFGIFVNKSLEIMASLFGEKSWRYTQFKAIEWQYKPGLRFAGMDLDTPTRKKFLEGVESVYTIIDDAIQDLKIEGVGIMQVETEAETDKNISTKIFITHGTSPDWMIVRDHVEKILKRDILELGEFLSSGKTIIEKLEIAAEQCFYAIVIMSGDDVGNKVDEASKEESQLRVRENVMHEIGYFQGRLGRSKVILLHEKGVSLPSNLQGIVYEEYPKGYIQGTFIKLQKEITAASVNIQMDDFK